MIYIGTKIILCDASGALRNLRQRYLIGSPLILNAGCRLIGVIVFLYVTIQRPPMLYREHVLHSLLPMRSCAHLSAAPLPRNPEAREQIFFFSRA